MNIITHALCFAAGLILWYFISRKVHRKQTEDLLRILKENFEIDDALRKENEILRIELLKQKNPPTWS